ncbi:flagellar protein FlgN [Cohnella sp. GCM10020058]|uniref:flagellar protein FlgN n=1 Tax=Cohnella sp. GCM10020058 TaxID=3317330 RepID=UPI00363B85B5
MSFLQLKKALEELNVMLDEMLPLARDKSEVIVRNKVEDLVSLTSRELRLTARMEEHYREIERATSSCWTELGLRARPERTLADLIQAIPRYDGKRALTDLASKLKEKHAELKILNERNQLLVKQSLDWIDYELHLIAGPLEQEITYSSSVATQSYSGGSYRRVFDARA